MPDAVRAWRRTTRADLIGRRTALPRETRHRVRQTVAESLLLELARADGGCIGFYWPIRGEINLRPLLTDCVAAGFRAALPVVVAPDSPVEFWEWTPDTRLVRGFWNIPVPHRRRPADPTILLVPLVGFDGEGYRLGYGGGYYDRTLAAMQPRPRAIGVGYDLGSLPTILPQPHDIPMNAVVTEAGIVRWPDR